MTWKPVDRWGIVGGWHLLGVSLWPWERFDLFKSKREQVLGCSEEHPPRRARISRPAPFNAFACKRNHNKTKAELFSAAPCCVTGFVYDWAWILHGSWHFKNPCYGRTVKVGWAQTWHTNLPFHLSAAGPRLANFKKGGPYRYITFHKNRMLHLPVISWTFIVLLSSTCDQVNLESLHERWTNSLPWPDTKILCLAPPEG